MRGSLSYEDAFFLGSEDIEVMSKLVKENLDITKKSNLPYF